MGVFATRSPFRPNPIGLSSVRLEGIETDGENGLVLIVTGADLMDGTPIYDIKPYLPGVDAHPEATDGFVGAHPQTLLTVALDPSLTAVLSAGQQAALREILAQDPRPAYHAGQPDKMPSFEVVDQDGAPVRSEDFIGKGRKTIVYFYPKDNTSGCTAEACSFRDNYAELTAAGYNVVGVSKDSAKSHSGFRAKFELPFRLLADTSLQMLQDFGAWGEKKMYGKTTMGTLRRTFIFDENGILERIIEKVDTKNAAGQILEG